MLTWLIDGPDLPSIRVKAESFDEALEEARLYNPMYCGGRVVDEKMEEKNYVYGMKYRPAGPGCQPKDGLVFIGKSMDKKYYSILYYDRKLTEEETRDYELEFIIPVVYTKEV